MTSTISITQDNLTTALRGWLLSVIAGEVIAAQQNRVAMPAGPFCQITPLFMRALSTDRASYVDPGVNPGTESHSRSTQWTAQLDFYGSTAADNAAIVATLIRTDTTCTYFAGLGLDMQPLYAGEPKQTSMITGEQQYLSRWTLEFVAQFNPVVQAAQDFAASLRIGLADIDVVFPPT